MPNHAHAPAIDRKERQAGHGKSTWLEAAMRDTVREHGAGTAFFLDGDYVRDADHLSAEVSRLAAAYRADAPVRRLFVDEITAVIMRS